jgi:hypothetical protein
MEANKLDLLHGVKVLSPETLDPWEGPWVSVAEAILEVPESVRYLGREVIINEVGQPSKRYVWKNGIADLDLIEVIGGTTIGSGLTDNDGTAELGGTLTKHTDLYLDDKTIRFQKQESLSSATSTILTINPESIELKYIDNIGSIKRKEFKIDANETIFRDDFHLTGLQYHADYSVEGSVNPRWIPDWGFVETKLGDKIGTASNGLTKTGDDIKLGGTLVENTTILGDAGGNHDFAIGKSTKSGFTGTRIKNFIIKLKGEVLWGIHESGFYHYFNWGENGLEINGDVSGVRSYAFKLGEETSLSHTSSVGDGYQIYANKDEFFLQSTKDGETKEIWGESGVNDNGIVITDTNEVGLVNAADYTAKQLLNDRAITDVGGIKQLISTIPTNISREVATYADLPSDALDKEQVYVVDASLDPTVTSGWAIYQSVGDKPAGSWIKLMEQESLDLDLTKYEKRLPTVFGSFSGGLTATATSGLSLTTIPTLLLISYANQNTSAGTPTLNLDGLGAKEIWDSRTNTLHTQNSIPNGKRILHYYADNKFYTLGLEQLFGQTYIDNQDAKKENITLNVTGSFSGGLTGTVVTGQSLTSQPRFLEIDFANVNTGVGVPTLNVDGTGALQIWDSITDAPHTQNSIANGKKFFIKRFSGRYYTYQLQATTSKAYVDAELEDKLDKSFANIFIYATTSDYGVTFTSSVDITTPGFPLLCLLSLSETNAGNLRVTADTDVLEFRDVNNVVLVGGELTTDKVYIATYQGGLNPSGVDAVYRLIEVELDSGRIQLYNWGQTNLLSQISVSGYFETAQIAGTTGGGGTYPSSLTSRPYQAIRVSSSGGNGGFVWYSSTKFGVGGKGGSCVHAIMKFENKVCNKWFGYIQTPAQNTSPSVWGGDGAWAEIVDNVLSFKCMAGGVTTTALSTYTLNYTSEYKFIITIPEGSSSARLYVYDLTLSPYAIVYSALINTNIPNPASAMFVTLRAYTSVVLTPVNAIMVNASEIYMGTLDDYKNKYEFNDTL